jgi:hypothetical protein
MGAGIAETKNIHMAIVAIVGKHLQCVPTANGWKLQTRQVD